MPKDEIEYRFPLIPALLLAGIYILAALMEHFNWTPFW